MILLRLEGLEGKYCDITGGQDKYRYGESGLAGSLSSP